MLYKFELEHNDIEATKSNCYVKSEDAVDHSTVTRWFEKFCSDCMNLDDQVSLRPLLQAIEADGAVTLCWILLKYCKAFDSP